MCEVPSHSVWVSCSLYFIHFKKDDVYIFWWDTYYNDMVKKLYCREIKKIVGPHPSAISACKTMARRVGMGIAPEQLQKGV